MKISNLVKKKKKWLSKKFLQKKIKINDDMFVKFLLKISYVFLIQIMKILYQNRKKRFMFNKIKL